MKNGILFIFPNVHAVMKADRLCQSHGIKTRVIPVPEHLSSECGMCLLVGNKYIEVCEEAFCQNNLTFSKGKLT